MKAGEEGREEKGEEKKEKMLLILRDRAVQENNSGDGKLKV